MASAARTSQRVAQCAPDDGLRDVRRFHISFNLLLQQAGTVAAVEAMDRM
jgi:hypothetical protein